MTRKKSKADNQQKACDLVVLGNRFPAVLLMHQAGNLEPLAFCGDKIRGLN